MKSRGREGGGTTFLSVPVWREKSREKEEGEEVEEETVALAGGIDKATLNLLALLSRHQQAGRPITSRRPSP